jgi:hypothetical protein
VLNEFTIGLRVVGPFTGVRRRVPWREAFAAHLACEPRAQGGESYLSVFTFDAAMAEHLSARGSPAGFEGETCAEFVTFDIDRENEIAQALADTRILAGVLEETFEAPTAAIQVFFSGSKGFHILVPTDLWSPTPSVDFSRVARVFAERIAAEAKVAIDSSIYSRVSLIRSPNSRHPATGLFKVPLTVDQIDSLDDGEIRELARQPIPAAPSQREASACCSLLAAEWQAAEEEVAKFNAERAAHHSASEGTARLTRLTKSILRGECLDEGSRHRHLYSAAANLGECGASLHLALELLTDVGRECGLRPSDVAKQITDGHARGSNPA